MNIKHVMTPNPSYCVLGDSSIRAARIMKDRNVGRSFAPGALAASGEGGP